MSGEKARPESRHANVVQSDDVEWKTLAGHGDFHDARSKSLSLPTGGRKLGCSMIELPPGKQSFPFHYHLANEEAIYVLEGSGALRLGAEIIAVGAGDDVALPVAAALGRQMINNSDSALRYLCFSTMIEPDVAIYPDSNKVATFGGAAPGGREEEFTHFSLLDGGAAAEYWDGEGHCAMTRATESQKKNAESDETSARGGHDGSDG